MFTIIKNNKLVYILLFLVIILAASLRLYKLDSVPPSISWDEAANGYNAYTIANWGQDEWGRSFPLFFKSFEDDKHPVLIYITAVFVKFLDLSEFSTRLPAAVFGIFNVIMIFFLARVMFKKEAIALFAAFLLAISPYNIQFSRFSHELNFAVFFYMLGLFLFFKGIDKKNLLPFSIVSFAVSFLTYHSAKVIIPPTILLLAVLYYKDLIKAKTQLMIIGLILLIMSIIIITNPQLLGFARINQTYTSEKMIKKTEWFKKTNNIFLSRAGLIFDNYRSHFSTKYLLISGDQNARHSSQGVGEFYVLDILFLIIGSGVLLWQRTKAAVVLLVWALLAPIPASLVQEAPHAARAMFMTGSWQLIAAVGFGTLLSIMKNKISKIFFTAAVLLIYSYTFFNYLNYYFTEYSQKYAIEWQYGMKQIVQYVQQYNGFSRAYMTDVRSQPYIFFLYYLKTPLPELLETVDYNQDDLSRSYNLVHSFNDYQFGGWDELESMPDPNILYIIGPSKYDGLRHKAVFNVKKMIKYPDGKEAFYLVSRY